jgi:hypothetical protein
MQAMEWATFADGLLSHTNEEVSSNKEVRSHDDG